MLPKHSFNPQSTPTASEWKKKHDSFNLHARTPSHPSRESHSIFSTFDSWLDLFSPGNLTRITINENECAPCQHYEHIKRWGDPVTCRCVDATAYVCKRSQLSVRACDVCVSTVCVCVCIDLVAAATTSFVWNKIFRHFTTTSKPTKHCGYHCVNGEINDERQCNKIQNSFQGVPRHCKLQINLFLTI